MSGRTENLTQLMVAAGSGDEAANNQLFELIYVRLRAIAENQRRKWSGDYTMSATAIVNEAFLKMSGGDGVTWENRGHFFSVAATAMRHVLVNYAEKRHAAKRGGGLEHMPLDEGVIAAPDKSSIEVLALDAALSKLSQENEALVRVIECRYFAGFDISETAEALATSPATVKRHTKLGVAWLAREMGCVPRIPDS